MKRCSSRGLAISSLVGSTVLVLSMLLCPVQVVAKEPGSSQRTPVEVYVDELVEQARQAELWKEPSWLRLGHYRKGWLGGYESEVDGRAFFLAEDGKEDPQAELEASLRAFFGPAPEETDREHPFCRFPARLNWLSQQLEFDWNRLPRQGCPRLIEFVQQVRPESLTLVFSSYYLNNPASAFGHTFLRVNKASQAGESRQALLDYGIDFSASVDTNNALVYAAKGLLGMFPGVYRRIPYYYKVREYNDFESRDIWEYELSLPPEQALMVVAHIWELGDTYFDYYYLSENCSYHILGALEVADPELELVEHVNWPAVPVDTIRALYKNPGLVRSVHYRPSARTQFSARLSHLTPEEVDVVAELMSDPARELPATLSKEQEVRILDAALDVADSKFASELVKDADARDRESTTLQQELLERRARLLLKSDEFEISPPVRLTPHLGHDTRRLQLGSGYGPERGAYHQASFRLALHDLADPPRGYPESAQIEFLPFTLRYFAENPLIWLEELRLVKVMSVSPWTRFEKPLSWTVRAGWDRIYDRGCGGCLAAGGEVGGGFTLSALDDGLMFYALGVTELAALAPIRGGIADLPLRAGIGPDAGLRLRFSDDLVLHSHGRYSFLPTQSPGATYRAVGTLRYQYQQNFALEVEGMIEPREKHLGAASVIYF